MGTKFSITKGLDNWYTVNYDFCDRPDTPTWNVDLHPTRPAVDMGFQKAADYTAQKIAERYPNLHLAMSGGLDSNFVAEVLYRNKIPFTPIISAVPNNNYEHFIALNWCQVRNIKPILLEFKPNDPRLIKEIHDFGKIIGQVITLATVNNYMSRYVKNINGHYLTGDSPIIYSMQPEDSYYSSAGDIFDVWYCCYFVDIIHNGYHPNAFYQYTPEIMLGMAKEADTSLNDSACKAKLYDIPYRPKHPNPKSAIDEDVSRKVTRLWNIRKVMDIYPYHHWHKEDLINKLTNVV
jgi:hypothetical protein